MTKQDLKEVNIDRAKSATNFAFVLIVISLLTYILPSIFEIFDFGLILEGISLVSLIIARMFMSEYDCTKAKIFNVVAIIPIVIVLLYDFISMYITEGFVGTMLYADRYVWLELELILYVLVLGSAQFSLLKADEPEKYKESTDWFYENPDEEDKK